MADPPVHPQPHPHPQPPDKQPPAAAISPLPPPRFKPQAGGSWLGEDTLQKRIPVKRPSTSAPSTSAGSTPVPLSSSPSGPATPDEGPGAAKKPRYISGRPIPPPPPPLPAAAAPPAPPPAPLPSQTGSAPSPPRPTSTTAAPSASAEGSPAEAPLTDAMRELRDWLEEESRLLAETGMLLHAPRRWAEWVAAEHGFFSEKRSSVPAMLAALRLEPHKLQRYKEAIALDVNAKRARYAKNMPPPHLPPMDPLRRPSRSQSQSAAAEAGPSASTTSSPKPRAGAGAGSSREKRFSPYPPAHPSSASVEGSRSRSRSVKLQSGVDDRRKEQGRGKGKEKEKEAAKQPQLIVLDETPPPEDRSPPSPLESTISPSEPRLRSPILSPVTLQSTSQLHPPPPPPPPAPKPMTASPIFPQDPTLPPPPLSPPTATRPAPLSPSAKRARAALQPPSGRKISKPTTNATPRPRPSAPTQPSASASFAKSSPFLPPRARPSNSQIKHMRHLVSPFAVGEVVPETPAAWAVESDEDNDVEIVSGGGGEVDKGKGKEKEKEKVRVPEPQQQPARAQDDGEESVEEPLAALVARNGVGQHVLRAPDDGDESVEEPLAVAVARDRGGRPASRVQDDGEESVEEPLAVVAARQGAGRHLSQVQVPLQPPVIPPASTSPLSSPQRAVRNDVFLAPPRPPPSSFAQPAPALSSAPAPPASRPPAAPPALHPSSNPPRHRTHSASSLTQDNGLLESYTVLRRRHGAGHARSSCLWLLQSFCAANEYKEKEAAVGAAIDVLEEQCAREEREGRGPSEAEWTERERAWEVIKLQLRERGLERAIPPSPAPPEREPSQARPPTPPPPSQPPAPTLTLPPDLPVGFIESLFVLRQLRRSKCEAFLASSASLSTPLPKSLTTPPTSVLLHIYRHRLLRGGDSAERAAALAQAADAYLQWEERESVVTEEMRVVRQHVADRAASEMRFEEAERERRSREGGSAAGGGKEAEGRIVEVADAPPSAPAKDVVVQAVQPPAALDVERLLAPPPPAAVTSALSRTASPATPAAAYADPRRVPYSLICVAYVLRLHVLPHRPADGSASTNFRPPRPPPPFPLPPSFAPDPALERFVARVLPAAGYTSRMEQIEVLKCLDKALEEEERKGGPEAEDKSRREKEAKRVIEALHKEMVAERVSGREKEQQRVPSAAGENNRLELLPSSSDSSVSPLRPPVVPPAPTLPLARPAAAGFSPASDAAATAPSSSPAVPALPLPIGFSSVFSFLRRRARAQPADSSKRMDPTALVLHLFRRRLAALGWPVGDAEEGADEALSCAVKEVEEALEKEEEGLAEGTSEEERERVAQDREEEAMEVMAELRREEEGMTEEEAVKEEEMEEGDDQLETSVDAGQEPTGEAVRVEENGTRHLAAADSSFANPISPPSLPTVSSAEPVPPCAQPATQPDAAFPVTARAPLAAEPVLQTAPRTAVKAEEQSQQAPQQAYRLPRERDARRVGSESTLAHSTPPPYPTAETADQSVSSAQLERGSSSNGAIDPQERRQQLPSVLQAPGQLTRATTNEQEGLAASSTFAHDSYHQSGATSASHPTYYAQPQQQQQGYQGVSSAGAASYRPMPTPPITPTATYPTRNSFAAGAPVPAAAYQDLTAYAGSPSYPSTSNALQGAQSVVAENVDAASAAQQVALMQYHAARHAVEQSSVASVGAPYAPSAYWSSSSQQSYPQAGGVAQAGPQHWQQHAGVAPHCAPYNPRATQAAFQHQLQQQQQPSNPVHQPQHAHHPQQWLAPYNPPSQQMVYPPQQQPALFTAENLQAWLDNNNMRLAPK
ncbi:hypothetical protein JCM6882_001475 [Rhodosporidiobolus microsporus]